MTNFLVFEINLGFLLFLFILTTVIIAQKIAKTPTREDFERNRAVNKSGLVILPITFSIGIIIMTISLVYQIPIKQGDDITNWVTLIVEIGIGITIALSILIYSRFVQNKATNRREDEKREKRNHSKDTIYRTLRQIHSIVDNRERIRTRNPLGMSPENLQIEIRFSNRQVARIIESLQFVVTIHSENLPLRFIERVRDSIRGFDFILTRLEILPFEECDPNGLTRNIQGFIDELERIDAEEN